MSGWTYPLSSGVPLSEIAIRVALGRPPVRVRPVFDRTTAERAVISIPGRLREITGIDEARRLPGVEEIFVSASPGQTVRFPRNNVEKLGSVIAAAGNREDAIVAAEEAVRRIVPVLEPRSQLTDAFLFAGPNGNSAGPSGALHRAFETWTAPDLAPPDWSEVQRDLGRGTPCLSVPRPLREATTRDWAYRTPSESVDFLALHGLCTVREVESLDDVRDPLSRLFLSALATGGLQGGRYVLESCSDVDYTPVP
jgi:hypothetical protein